MEKIRQAFPTIQISSEAELLKEYETTTFHHQQKITSVIFPRTVEEVSAITAFCQKEKIRIYPISCGRNWGFGSKVPVCDKAIVLDLKLMNKIENLDLTFGTVSVEPGVTFEALCAEVYKSTDKYVVNIIGGSPRASVIGNILERGDGTSTYADRSEFMANLEIVMPDGRVIHTGHGDYMGCKTKDIYKHGMGPNLDQLFVQSNLGIVTRITLWLQPKYHFVETYSIGLASQENTTSLVDKLRFLKMTNVINAGGALWNDFRAVSTLVQVGEYADMITREDLKQITGNAGLLNWFGVFSVHSMSEEIAIANRKFVLDEIEAYCDEITVVIKNNMTGSISFVNAKGPDKGVTVFGKLEALSSVMNGNPSYQSQRSCYWRKTGIVPESIDINPDRDKCGILWAGVTVPMEGNNFNEATAMIEQIMVAHLFEPHLTLLFPSDKTFYCLAMLTYDRDKPGADEAAQKCHDVIMEKCMQIGYFPYRLGIQSMTSVKNVESNYSDLIQKLKNSMDPNDILSPGRYDFRNLWQTTDK